jgi:predicted RNA-binding protein YlqC (UPF0109 family)
MKELVAFIVKAIASNPDEVRVTQEEIDGRIILRLEVAPEDKGKVIGRHGRVAESIRVLLRVAAVKQEVRATMEII